jgi:hypothetical protein
MIGGELKHTREAAGRDRANRLLLDLAAQADVREGIRQGLEDARKRRTRPVEEFFREFEHAHSL